MKFSDVAPGARADIAISSPFYEFWNRLNLSASEAVLDNITRSVQEIAQALLNDLDSMILIPERSSITSSFADGDLVEIAELCANLEMAWKGAKLFFRPYGDIFSRTR
mgnify:CR=1 FL=1